MIKFTTEEISLCKQIAEKHRKDIDDGDWIYHEPHNNYFLVVQHVILQYQLQTQKWFDELNAEHRKMNIPLWTISDCLEFLREKGFQTFLIMELAKGWGCDGYIKDKIYEGTGSSILEACLKAVLAVLEEE
jgi:hypothetical protein